MSIERRDDERFSLNLKAKLSYRHVSDNSPVFDTVAANISAGGVFLETNEQIAMASKVRLEFYLNIAEVKMLKFILSEESIKKIKNSGVWVTATGVVIRQEENGIGVIFDTDYQVMPIKPSELEK